MVRQTPCPLHPSGSTEIFIARSPRQVCTQIQVGQATEDERRNILEITVIRSSVHTLRNSDIRGSVQKALEAYPCFRTGEWSSGATVDATAEGEVLTRVAAIDVERRRIVEPAGVAVGGAVEDHHGRTGGDLDAVEHRADPASRKSPFTGLSARGTPR